MKCGDFKFILIISLIFWISASLILSFCYIREAIYNDLYNIRTCYPKIKDSYIDASNVRNLNILMSVNRIEYDRDPNSKNSMQKWIFIHGISSDEDQVMYPIGESVPCYASINDIRLEYYDMTWSTAVLIILSVLSLVLSVIYSIIHIYKCRKRNEYAFVD